VSSLHAKTMVIDSKIDFIGTFNFDPRSENISTEVEAINYDTAVARAVEAANENDMSAGNSWNVAEEQPDQFASIGKRSKVWGAPVNGAESHAVVDCRWANAPGGIFLP
jgi:cardiolipin synthase C